MGQVFKREDLLERVEMVIDNLFELLGLKQYGESSQRQFTLFQEACEIRQKLTTLLQPRKSSKEAQYIEVIQKSADQLQEFRQTKEYQKQCLAQAKQRYGQLCKLIEMLYVGTCEIKYTESLIRSNVLLKRQIGQLRQIQSKMQEELGHARQSNRQVAELEQNTVAKAVLGEFQQTMKLKQEEKGHFEQEDRRVEGEYQRLMDEYRQLLEQSNEEKREDMRTGVTFPSSYKETVDSRVQSTTKQPKPTQIGSQMLSIKVIPQPPNVFYEQVATIVLLFVTVFIALAVVFK